MKRGWAASSELVIGIRFLRVTNARSRSRLKRVLPTSPIARSDAILFKPVEHAVGQAPGVRDQERRQVGHAIEEAEALVIQLRGVAQGQVVERAAETQRLQIIAAQPRGVAAQDAELRQSRDLPDALAGRLGGGQIQLPERADARSDREGPITAVGAAIEREAPQVRMGREGGERCGVEASVAHDLQLLELGQARERRHARAAESGRVDGDPAQAAMVGERLRGVVVECAPAQHACAEAARFAEPLPAGRRHVIRVPQGEIAQVSATREGRHGGVGQPFLAVQGELQQSPVRGHRLQAGSDVGRAVPERQVAQPRAGAGDAQQQRRRRLRLAG